MLTPKFQLPPLHPSLVSRGRLLALLDRGLEHKLTLVSAPAGFGKTTLVRQWVAERDKQQHVPPVAWVSLDTRDNDPVRFWHYLMVACQVFHDDLAHEALALLHTIPQPPFESSLTETALAAFLNALAQCEAGGLLLLDDYHVITSPLIQETMTFFLEHLPAGIHVMLLTRSDPPFPLARLRARNELYEVRTPALRFSPEETAAFLQQTIAVPLVPKITQQINTYLEGWAAGLRMLSLALQGRTASTEIEPFLRAFVGNQRALQEYFLAEVLDIQPEPVQRFLLQTSVLGRLTGSLCDAVTGEHGSEHVLERLERENLFLEPLDHAGPHAFRMDRRWYRYHGLFAEVIRAEARRRLGEDALRVLSSHASHWYEAQGLYAEAVESALHAQDYEKAAALIERILEAPHTYQQVNEYHTHYHWLEQIPECVLHLSVAGKAELLYHGRVDEARSLLGEAASLCEEIHNQYFKHATTNMLATVFFEQGALSRAAEYYQRALGEARERMYSDDMGYALLGLARIAYERNELEAAQQQAEEVLAIGKSLAHEGHEIQATLLLARVQHARGERLRPASA